jgi:4-amino-4-deoxy-L-arabinose transferase-like glycosyltransferase
MEALPKSETPQIGFARLVHENMAALLTLFVAALLIRLCSYTGLIASDDLGYSHFARQISNGSYHLFPHHYAIRYGIILPLALLYHLFGVHEWTTVFLPILGSAIAPPLLLPITYRLFPDCGVPWIAGILLATFPVDTHYGSIMVPEPVLQALTVVCLLLLLEAKRLGNSILGMLAGVGLGLSYLTKEPGLIVGGAFLLVLISARHFKLAVAVLAGMLLVISGECIWYVTQSGDLLFRTHALAIHNRSPEVIADNADLWYRLIKGYPRMILIPNIDFGLHSIFALICTAVALIVPRIRKQPGVFLAVCWALLPFLYLDFGSSSLTSYVALPMSPRYIAISYAPLFCISAMIVWMVSGKDLLLKVGTYAVVGAVSLVGLLCGLETSGTGYRSAEVRAAKQIIAVGGNISKVVCASSPSEQIRCADLAAILERPVSGSAFTYIKRALREPQALVKAHMSAWMRIQR